MHRSGTTFVLAASLLLGLPAAAHAEGRPADRVVLVSVDGLLPEYYLRPAEFGLELPNLAALREAGSWAEALRAFARVDAHIGEIVKAAEESGIRPRTAFVVTGDHGFYRVHSALQPNVVLRREGLLKTGPDGKIREWRAATHRAAIRLKDPKDAATARHVEALFRELADGRYRGLFRVVGRTELDALGSDPEALLMLEPVEGYMVTDGFEDDAFIAPTQTRGQHGYLPTAPGIQTGLMLSGAGVRRGVVVPVARQVNIAPTVARLLGLEMEDADGTAMVGVLDRRGGNSEEEES